MSTGRFYQEWSPEELGMKDVSIEQTTNITSALIDVSEFDNFMVSVLVDNTGGGTGGTVRPQIIFAAEDGTQISDAVDLDNGSTIATTADKKLLYFIGARSPAAEVGDGAPNAALDNVGAFGQLKINLALAANSAAGTIDVRLRAQR